MVSKNVSVLQFSVEEIFESRRYQERHVYQLSVPFFYFQKNEKNYDQDKNFVQTKFKTCSKCF